MMADRYGLTYGILFNGDSAYTDISHLVDSSSTVTTKFLTGDKLTSAIDSCSFTLKNKSNLSPTQQDVIQELISAQSLKQKVLFTLSDESSRIFTGYIRPSLSQTYQRKVPSSVSVSAEDMSYLLDSPMNNVFEYPDHIDKDGFYIFNPSDKSHSIIHQRLYDAGYEDYQINNWMSPILDQITYTSGEQDSKRTYRNYIDTLLFEYGYVQYFDNLGAWSYKKLSWDSIVPDHTRTEEWLSDQGFKVMGSDNEIDGVKVEWATLDILRNTRVYSANLPISDGVFTGKEIDGGAYYPEDSDVDDVWQEFKDDWADKPYLMKQSRKENEDLTLLCAKNIRLHSYVDEEVQLDTSDDLPQFEPKRAKYRFINTSDETKKIYLFDLSGDVLIRSEVSTMLSPITSIMPKEYTTEFIFSYDKALLLTSRLQTWYNNSDNIYEWSEFGSVDFGDIVQVSPVDSVISTYAFVGSYVETYLPDGRKQRAIRAFGVDEYQSLPLEWTRRVNRVKTDANRVLAKDSDSILFDIASIDKVVVS